MSAVVQVEVVSAHGRLWSGTSTHVQVPLIDGALGILPRRQPLLATLGTGAVVVTTGDNDTLSFSVNGGVVSVDSDYVTIVTPEGTHG